MKQQKNKLCASFLRANRADITKLLLAAVFVSAVFVPLLQMFLHMDRNSLGKVLSSPVFAEAVGNSITATLLATAITLAISFALAFCTERVRIPGKSALKVLFVMPMLIPSISIGMGLVILYGNNGILTSLLGAAGNIYGLQGIVSGSVMYAFPVAYLMISDVLRYEDGSAYEAARVMGIPGWRQFFGITLPYLRKPLISTVFSVFSLIITDYGVPLMVGGNYKTIATLMYQEVIGQLDFGRGSVYGTFLLLPAVVAFLVDMMNQDKGNHTFVTRSCGQSDNVAVKTAAMVFCGIVCVFVLMPVISFVLLAFTADYPRDMHFTLENLWKTFDLKAGRYLGNSVMIALCTSAVGVCISFITAYLAARMKSPVSRFLHLAAMTSAAIPGVVLGLSYVLTFNSSAIYGTIVIMIMVNTVHFITSPYLMMYNSLSKINENLESVAQTMGIGRICLMRDVFLPQCKSTLCEMSAYFFVNCMMTISAVSFLSTSANKPVALMINQFEAQMQLEYAAVVALMILVINFMIKGIFQMISRGRK